MWHLFQHTDSRFDVDIMCRYVRAYQETHPLTIGELWGMSADHTVDFAH